MKALRLLKTSVYLVVNISASCNEDLLYCKIIFGAYKTKLWFVTFKLTWHMIWQVLWAPQGGDTEQEDIHIYPDWLK